MPGFVGLTSCRWWRLPVGVADLAVRRSTCAVEPMKNLSSVPSAFSRLRAAFHFTTERMDTKPMMKYQTISSGSLTRFTWIYGRPGNPYASLRIGHLDWKTRGMENNRCPTRPPCPSYAPRTYITTRPISPKFH